MLATMRLWCVFCVTGSLLSETGSPALLSHEDPVPDKATGQWPGDNSSMEIGNSLGEIPSTAQEKMTSPFHHLPGDTRCFGRTSAHEEVIKDMLLALREDFGKESELRKEGLNQFGVCSNSKDRGLITAMSTLADEANQHGLHVWHPTKELMEGAAEGEGLVLTLNFSQPPLLKNKAILLLAFRNPQTRPLGTITFSSHILKPYKQTVCISDGTEFLILTVKPSEGKSHLGWRIIVESISNTEQKMSELRSILGEGTSNVIPLVLSSMDRGFDERTTEHQSPSLAPSGTYNFLCELQSFLSDVLKPLKQSGSMTAPVPLYSLHSLPSLSLGVSSSEAMLAKLINNSGPTLFSFPTQRSVLQGYHGELALPPDLTELLRQRLEEVAIQIRGEEVGSAVMDRLRRLQELSFLPKEDEELPTGAGSPGEMQYRALLLFKALQTVVGAWELERGKRATRAGQEGTGQGKGCRLHSLKVSLKKVVVLPDEANIFNCHGECKFPLSKANNHAVLLLQQNPAPEYSLCCVPVAYEGLQVVDLGSSGAEIVTKPNMVAKECECR
ncbi:hypothetical protein UPYG_G00035150 [Umbra pygmaea]|uniref:TGF-beta family profile domain-containing protein n=1 Tax=Umbra pygmaea TaxID=75934 RepID=A0ABD0XNN0_UMBPY